ncbi:glycerophosphodiester phosphodiesterase [Dyella sp.]|uniref:glycerophosphodiester phosphodiesterase n=1 Tax=Dyella sp. TaxID=1869338 RepID=UPI002ED24486
MKRILLLVVLILVVIMSHVQASQAPIASKVMVLGHRGASALRPEHTLASYAKAIADGADFIEPDLVMTRDGVMVARHENEIGGTTDVAQHPEFVQRKTTRIIDGHSVTGWFTEDFTLAELKTLRARERLPEFRGTRYDGQFQVPTFDEIIDFVAAEAATHERSIGIIPEIKHGTYFQKIGLPMEQKVIAALDAHAYTRTAPIEIQSFETANLRYLRSRLGKNHPNIRLLQLIDDLDQQPFDIVATGGKLTYGQMLQPKGLHDIATYADAIGPSMRAIIPLRADGRLGEATEVVRDAHAERLEVHVYTFRPENHFQAKDFWQGSDPRQFNEAGSIAEIRAYLDAGIDAFFTDDPAIGRKALAGR